MRKREYIGSDYIGRINSEFFNENSYNIELKKSKPWKLDVLWYLVSFVSTSSNY